MTKDAVHSASANSNTEPSSAMSSCLFCNIDPGRVIAENELAFAVKDGYPVTPGHCLIIPKRHIEDYFGLAEDEVIACNRLLQNLKSRLQKQHPEIEGFNIGMNAGSTAGQTIFHCHIHLIPRRQGDVENPKGGVRNLIPGMGPY